MEAENPYSPPKSSVASSQENVQIFNRGRYIVFDPEADWPSRCFKCNKETNLGKEVVLTYINPWIYLSLFLTFVITIVLALIFRKRFKIYLPLCDEHIRKRKNLQLFQWGMVFIFVASLIAGIITGIQGFSIVSIVSFLLIFISAMFGRIAFAAKYKNGSLWVTGSGKEFRLSLPDFVG